MENSKKLKPGRWLYLIGALVIAAAIIVSIATAVSAAMQLINGVKADVPGTTSVSLDKAGTYTIAYLYKESNGNKTAITNPSELSNLKLTVTDPAGHSVSVNKITAQMMQFKADKAGTYTIAGAYDGTKGDTVQAIISSSNSMLTGPYLSIILYGGIIAGVAIIIVTAVLRKKSKKLTQYN